MSARTSRPGRRWRAGSSKRSLRTRPGECYLKESVVVAEELVPAVVLKEASSLIFSRP